MRLVLPTILLSILFPLLLNSQNEKFPEEWQGKWKGELKIYQDNQLMQMIPMVLDIDKIDTSSWTFYITYGEGENKQLRPYELYTVDNIKGHYRIDEQNGIFLEAFLQGNCLYERFSVGGNMLTNRLCKLDSTLFYEITVGAIQEISTTGGGMIKSDSIPEVKSYNIPSVQKAELHRME